MSSASPRSSSVFLRIEETGQDQVAATLIEIDEDGDIPREVGVAEDGTPVYVTRPGEYGRWNDSEYERAKPGTAAFEEVWAALGTPISAKDFESTFAEGDASLPHTIGGTPLWLSDLVSWAVIVAGLALVGGIVYVFVRLMLG